MKRKKIVYLLIGVVIVLIVIAIMTIFIFSKKESSKENKQNETSPKTQYTDTGKDSEEPKSTEEQLQILVGENQSIERYEQQADGTYYVYVKSKKENSAQTGYYVVNLETEEVEYHSSVQMTVGSES